MSEQLGLVIVKKALALLLKPANSTPSNTRSLRSFHRDTDKGIKIRRYCEVLQRGGAYYYYYYFGVRCARPGESEDTLSVQRPQPQTTNPWKEEKDKTVRDKKRKSRSCQQESIGSALETLESHTIKHRVTKIVPKRHREGRKASAILRSPTTRRRERVPMSNQSTTSNTCRHIRQRQCTA